MRSFVRRTTLAAVPAVLILLAAGAARAQLPFTDSLKQGMNVNGWKFSGGNWKFEAGGLHARNTMDIADHTGATIPKGIFDYAYLPGIGTDMIYTGKITLLAIDPTPKFVRVGLAVHMSGAGDITDKKWMFMYARVKDTDQMAPVLLEEGVAWRMSDPNMTQITTGTVYNYKMQVSGTDVAGRLWPDGQPEPTDWQVEDAFSTAQIKNTAIGLIAVGVEALFSDLSAVPLPNSKLGTISGKIQDSAGGVVGSATVTASNSTGPVAQATSRPDGSYGLQLAPDTYDLSITAEGYATGTVKGIQVGAGAVVGAQNVSLTKSYPSINQAADPIMVDGTLNDSEWGDAVPISLNRKDQVVTGATAWQGTDDESGTVMLKWDTTNLYIGARILDATPGLNTQMGNTIWNGDALEVAFQLDPFSSTRTAYDPTRDYQLVVGLGVANGGTPTWGIFSAGKFTDLGDLTGQVAVRTTAGFTRPGYTVEVALPWASVPGAKGAPPVAGQGAAFDVALDNATDATMPVRTEQLVYNSQADFYANPSHLVPSQWAPVGGAVVPVGGGTMPVCGDLNGNGKVDVADATVALRIGIGLVMPTAAQTTAACGNSINVAFATVLLRAAVGVGAPPAAKM